jgi:hypothetical protein
LLGPIDNEEWYTSSSSGMGMKAHTSFWKGGIKEEYRIYFKPRWSDVSTYISGYFVALDGLKVVDKDGRKYLDRAD